MAMSTDEIRETYLSFFESEGHLRVPSASLVPAEYDPSVLFTIAGMVPFKPYLLGQETPPRKRVTDCQKTFRTVDIEIIGTTARHLTFFEMMGNWSFGDYFKREAQQMAWRLSTEAFGLAPEDIWVTVFAGDDALGLGPDEESIGYWLEIGVPREKIVECDREENGGRWGRPARAVPTPSSTSTAAWTTAPRTTCRAGRTSASSSSGTSCSCSSTRTPRVSSPRWRPTASTPAWASTAWPASCRAPRPCSRPISSPR